MQKPGFSAESVVDSLGKIALEIETFQEPINLILLMHNNRISTHFDK
jgi:hypothetical protein